MTLDEAIEREETLAYSCGERYKRGGEPVGNLDELEVEHRQLADWLKDYKRLLGQEPKTGRWVGTEYDGYVDGAPVYDTYECSECGWEMYGGENSLTNYCPSCGAEMKY